MWRPRGYVLVAWGNVEVAKEAGSLQRVGGQEEVLVMRPLLAPIFRIKSVEHERALSLANVVSANGLQAELAYQLGTVIYLKGLALCLKIN